MACASQASNRTPLSRLRQTSVRHACLNAYGRQVDHLPLKNCRRRTGSPQKNEYARLQKHKFDYVYRRIHVLLQRKGWQVNAKRGYRLYKEEDVAAANKAPKGRASAKRYKSPVTAAKPNEAGPWIICLMSSSMDEG